MFTLLLKTSSFESRIPYQISSRRNLIVFIILSGTKWYNGSKVQKLVLFQSIGIKQRIEVHYHQLVKWTNIVVFYISRISFLLKHHCIIPIFVVCSYCYLISQLRPLSKVDKLSWVRVSHAIDGKQNIPMAVCWHFVDLFWSFLTFCGN